MTARALDDPARPPLQARARRHNDAVLGAAALAGLIVIVAWTVTGLDFLAIVAMTIALGSFVIARELDPPAKALLRAVPPGSSGAMRGRDDA